MSSSMHYFPTTRFVKATKDTQTKEDSTLPPHHSSGKETKDFYESLFVDSSSGSEEDEVQIIEEKPPAGLSKRYTSQDLFGAIGSDEMEDIIRQNVDLNVLDSYGWTPLMHAISDGSLSTTRLLLSKGANPALTKDKAGWSCLSLADKQGKDMMDLLSQGPASSSSRDDEPQEGTSTTCELCKGSFSDPKNVHCASVIHNFHFNRKNYTNAAGVHFGLFQGNRGYDLMLKKGWDPSKGLGPSGDGKLYPVKTILKRDRSGIGGSKEKARVTHFGPCDPASVAQLRDRLPPRGIAALGKKALKRKMALEKRKAENYRRELSDV